ncbi:uncharacterized protein Dwil_GK18141 [Drosophila willistoni]|uniref:Metalloendopeptidase n=1 Tax=Drosophila willistoni TaxID=7260 RepID=B4MYZ7_DROWI|nr:blastula protease 10 [Drosophila willistoni]EDW77336.2 uncharacterized protein Dwil_GK18141 [Drosophila willistoni]
MIHLNWGCLLTLLHLVVANPVSDDMLLTQEQREYLEGSTKNPHAKNVMLWSQYYWKNSIFVYSFGEGLSTSDKKTIIQAMSSITRQTSCVRFRQTRNRQEPQVIIQRKDSGCWSYVGFLNRMEQPLNLGSGCMSIGTIQHELLHALAIVHMHNDPLRDKFVKILYENIQDDMINNFRIYDSKDVADLGYGYDYRSIMHYGSYDFSKNSKRTIIPLQNVQIGQRSGLSPKDILKLKHIYCT